jgi:hypothetical protein
MCCALRGAKSAKSIVASYVIAKVISLKLHRARAPQPAFITEERPQDAFIDSPIASSPSSSYEVLFI